MASYLVPCASPPFCFVRRRCCMLLLPSYHVDQRIDGQTSVSIAQLAQRCGVPATLLLPQDECEGCRRKSPPGDRSGSQAGVRCRGMSPWGFDDGCSAQVGYLLYGDLQTERRYVWPRHKKCAVPMCRFDSFGSLSSALDQEGLHSYPLHLKSFSCMDHAMCCIFVFGLH